MAVNRKVKEIIKSVIIFKEDKAYDSAKNRFSEKAEVDYYSSQEHEAKAEFRVKNLTDNFLKEKGKVLDVGCAAGKISAILAKKGFIVEGIDLSENMIKKASKENRRIRNLKFRREDILDITPSGKYDYVIALFNLMTYFSNESDRLKALNNIVNSLKNGGSAIIEFANIYGNVRLFFKAVIFKIIFLISGKNRKFGDIYSNPMFHNSKEILYQHIFSKNEIIALLNKIPNISYKIIDYDLFYGTKSKKNFILLIKRIK